MLALEVVAGTEIIGVGFDLGLTEAAFDDDDDDDDEEEEEEDNDDDEETVVGSPLAGSYVTDEVGGRAALDCNRGLFRGNESGTGTGPLCTCPSTLSACTLAASLIFLKLLFNMLGEGSLHRCCCCCCCCVYCDIR